MEKGDYEVIVIGAGAAGLAAAERLARAGVRVLVLEARNRIGGRVWTRTLAGLDLPVELGAEFIHGRPCSTLALLKRAGTRTSPSRGDQRHGSGGNLRPADPFAAVREVLADTRSLDEGDTSFDTFLGRRREVPSATRRLARLMVQGFDAADPRLASARALAEEWNGATVGSSQPRPRGGYGPLLDWLAGKAMQAGARLRMDSVVREARWRPGRAEVRGDGFCFVAPRVIVTLPLGVLQRRAMRFIPDPGKGEALKRLVSGPVVKAVLRFSEAFWEKRYPGVAFFHTPEAAFPTFWAPLPARAPVLVGWAGGPKALEASRNVKMEPALLASLKRLFGRAMPPDQVLVHDWRQDPFALGAYSYVRVGGAGARETLAQPVARTLYFAGEAANVEGESGTVGGALQSGERAAEAVIRQANGLEAEQAAGGRAGGTPDRKR